MSDSEDRLSFSEWLVQPQSLIALSAVLLSLCGLFVSLYEASLIRQQQRGMVWPHLNIGPSFSSEGIAFNVENSGVGPARVRAAVVTHDGEAKPSWNALLQSLSVTDTVNGEPNLAQYRDLVNRRVLSPGSGQSIYRLSMAEEDRATRAFMEHVRQEILAGDVDVTLCYCSVYEECWTTSLQRQTYSGSTATEERETVRGTRRVDDCEEMETSDI